MKEFTEKEIKDFMKLLKDGILEYLNEKGYVNNLRKVNERVFALDDGYYLKEHLTEDFVISAFKEREELADLALSAVMIVADKHDNNRWAKKIKDFLPEGEVDKKRLIKMLDLRPFATKEDILKELEEIL